MTLPSSGFISFAHLNAEIGNGSNAISMAWVKGNTVYGYADFGSIRGLTYFRAYSSNGNISRSAGSTVTNCATNCASQQNGYGFDFDGGQTNCIALAATNCNQCGTDHGAHLQANCNCACNCYVCNCHWNNCNCNCNCNDCSGG